MGGVCYGVCYGRGLLARMMSGFESLKNEGNECFRRGQYELALELYEKALGVSPNNHVALSNRSLAFFKLAQYESALLEADRCINAHQNWAKGYARKAAALNALGECSRAKEVCVAGFALQDQALCKVFVEEWLVASRSLVSPRFDALKKPPWSDVLPESADLFCDDYCNLLHAVVRHRLSDAESMSHDQMTEYVQGAVKIAEGVFAEFGYPVAPALQVWADAATIRFESCPKSDWERLLGDLHSKTAVLVEWLKNGVHKSLRLVLDPVLMLALSAMLVRGNALCQAYTGFHTTEYLGYACVGFFGEGVLSDPKFVAFHMAVLSMILNSYRLRGHLGENDVDLIRGLCHKLENLLPHLPKGSKNYDIIKEHYQNTVKVFREICAKVVSNFTGSYDPKEALSELELTMLSCEENSDKAMDVVVKYITDIAGKSEATRTSAISHINFIDAENMLYITGILTKLGQPEQALTILHQGESMGFSLMANLMKQDVLSLDELPASITNFRKLVQSGAIWVKDHSPKDAADILLHWKSLFTELRAILIRLGLRECYREAFQAIQSYASKGDKNEMSQVQRAFQDKERLYFKQFSFPAIKALYDQGYDSIAAALQESDVAIDYIFDMYNPEHRNPPQPQACAIVIQPKKQPIILSVPNNLVSDLVRKWPQATYKFWHSVTDEFEEVTKALSEALFPEPIRKVLLDPKVTRVFISPDVDLVCFPIDQLPLCDDKDGSTLPLYERVSVSILSSPRELIRDATVRNLKLQATADECTDSAQKQAVENKKESEKASSNTATTSTADLSSQLMDKLHFSRAKWNCFIVANPDFKFEGTGEHVSSWKQWLSSFGTLLGSHVAEPISELKGTQSEAEEVYKYLSKSPDFEVHRPITQKEATITAVLSLDSPYILHLATHGYTSKKESVYYRGNFWTDESSGITLAGAQTFLDEKFEKIDPKAGTGHLNSIAICGMRLEHTRLVFVSACDSSLGSRPVQEMPGSVTQALRAAGAQTVISTLWVINDNEAKEFTSYFYNHLLSHPECRPSEALGHAKAAMRQNGKSMLHWGAYVCHGLDNPVTQL